MSNILHGLFYLILILTLKGRCSDYAQCRGEEIEVKWVFKVRELGSSRDWIWIWPNLISECSLKPLQFASSHEMINFFLKPKIWNSLSRHSHLRLRATELSEAQSRTQLLSCFLTSDGYRLSFWGEGGRGWLSNWKKLLKLYKQRLELFLSFLEIH